MSNTKTKRSTALPTHVVRVGHHDLRLYERVGDGSLPPLVLLNGFGCSIEVMGPLIAELDETSGVIVFDIPGIGGSSVPGRPYRLWEMASMIRRLAEELGHREVDVLGVSWGGALAQQFALQHRRACRRVVLVSTGPAPIMRPSRRLLREAVAPRRFDPDRGRAVAAELYGGRVKADPQLLDLNCQNM